MRLAYPVKVNYESGSALNNPDFAALARSYGYADVRITPAHEFEAELVAVLARPEGAVIKFVLDPEVITTRRMLSNITKIAISARAGCADWNVMNEANVSVAGEH